MTISKENNKIRQTSYLSVLGAVVRHEREIRGLTREEFADSVNFSKNSLARIETGFTPISIDKLRSIAQCLNVSPQDLLNKSDHICDLFTKKDINISEVKLSKSEDLLQRTIIEESKKHSGAISKVIIISESPYNNQSDLTPGLNIFPVVSVVFNKIFGRDFRLKNFSLL